MNILANASTQQDHTRAKVFLYMDDYTKRRVNHAGDR